ncbi:MAG: ribosome maturation factor RimM [Bacteroidota bacterium]|nr:ribosome maturation factor RimM [Bacteroidota bacterium]MDP4230298.1 ribosome maturation factor RimM [Bacteroidota bacterium]MDP4235615.1 ribosome maturation factor RimM [Bacteroidota bacterium]
MGEEEQILIGIIRRAHGLKGEVLVESYTFDKARFGSLKMVKLKFQKKADLHYTVSASRTVPQGILLMFDEVKDRTGADALRGAEIYIPISERMPLSEGRAYYDELAGMKVVDDDSDEELGTVKEVMPMPAGDVYVIRLIDGSEKLVTSAGEEIVRMDKKKREVRVRLLANFN